MASFVAWLIMLPGFPLAYLINKVVAWAYNATGNYAFSLGGYFVVCILSGLLGWTGIISLVVYLCNHVSINWH